MHELSVAVRGFTGLQNIAGERLLKRELTASPPDYFLRRAGLDELKTVAEGVALAHEGMDFNVP